MHAKILFTLHKQRLLTRVVLKIKWTNVCQIPGTWWMFSDSFKTWIIFSTFISRQWSWSVETATHAVLSHSHCTVVNCHWNWWVRSSSQVFSLAAAIHRRCVQWMLSLKITKSIGPPRDLAGNGRGVRCFDMHPTSDLSKDVCSVVEGQFSPDWFGTFNLNGKKPSIKR